MTGSVRFDRAAEYYDRTRVTSEDAMARTVELLSAELGGRGRVLEIGVGTGLLALPLHSAGVDVVGVDLSSPMLAKLREKEGTFRVAHTDATRLPFRDDAFGAAYLRWVLHLIPDWRSVAHEVVRVVRPSGVVLVNHGGFAGSFRLVLERTEEIIGRPLRPVGLPWDRWEELAAEMRALGAVHRTLESIVERSEEPLRSAVDGIGANRYSWTWGMTDAERTRAADELGRWLEARFGDLDAPYVEDVEVVWHAYDLP
jgi:SAM-dependent methyltransferase